MPHGKREQPLPLTFYSNLNKVVQPCLCLCFGFSQITITLLLRLITLHFSQIGFTDDLTFIFSSSCLPFFRMALLQLTSPSPCVFLYTRRSVRFARLALRKKSCAIYYLLAYLSRHVILPRVRS